MDNENSNMIDYLCYLQNSIMNNNSIFAWWPLEWHRKISENEKHGPKGV
jgi:hypothetical protein